MASDTRESVLPSNCRNAFWSSAKTSFSGCSWLFWLKRVFSYPSPVVGEDNSFLELASVGVIGRVAIRRHSKEEHV